MMTTNDENKLKYYQINGSFSVPAELFTFDKTILATVQCACIIRNNVSSTGFALFRLVPADWFLLTGFKCGAKLREGRSTCSYPCCNSFSSQLSLSGGATGAAARANVVLTLITQSQMHQIIERDKHVMMRTVQVQLSDYLNESAKLSQLFEIWSDYNICTTGWRGHHYVYMFSLWRGLGDPLLSSPQHPFRAAQMMNWRNSMMVNMDAPKKRPSTPPTSPEILEV